MLRRLFKGRDPLTHPDAAVRRSAVRELDDVAAQSVAEDLARLVREDPDAEVRRACLVRISDRDLLQSVLDDPALGEVAARRLRDLSPDSLDSPSEGTTTTVEQLARLPVHEAAAQLRAINDVEVIASLALKVRGELKELALEHPALQGAAALTRLEKQSRHKDKTVNRHARRQLERYRQLTAEADARRTRAEELSAALQRTPPAAQDQAWRERQHQLHQRLDAVLDEYRALRQALAGFGQDAPDLEALRADPTSLPPLEDAAAAEPTDGNADASEVECAEQRSGDGDPFEPLVQGFRDLDQALTSGRPFADITTQRQMLTDRWLTAADHLPPTDPQHQVFETVSHRFRELADAMERLNRAEPPVPPSEPLDLSPPANPAAHRDLWEAVAERRRTLKRLEQIHRQLRWPDWAPPTVEYAAMLDGARALGETLNRADALLRDELAGLEKQLSALADAIDEGSLNSAQSLLIRARALHDALPVQAARTLGKQLGKQAARLAELKDWQTFATSPKRESLVQAMASLSDSPLEPRAQADRIKELRRQWQNLGPVTQAADGRLADRFNAEAERAFEPCRAYFAEQAEQRQANLAERVRICDQLELYLSETDWDQADMKGAEKIMRAARDEWRRFHPVDRNPGKTVEARFERLQDRLHDLVKAEWDRNLHAKEQIVAEAEALLAADGPIQDKVTAAKRLQARWRDVGITPRRPDQQLWRTFRAACDGIFSARDQSRQAADAALDELESHLARQLDAFTTLLDGIDAGAAKESELRAFRQETHDVDRLPQARRRPLAERRSRLEAAYRALLDEQRRVGRRERLLELARWDEAMTAAEAARKAGHDADVPETPDGAGKLLEARLASARQDVPRDAARRLVVKAELAAGLDSPAEDEPLRLEVQVERLQAGLSGGRDDEGPGALAEAWCRLGPKDDGLAPLRDRLFAAATALL